MTETDASTGLDTFTERLDAEWAASGPPMDEHTAEALARALLPADRRIAAHARKAGAA